MVRASLLYLLAGFTAGAWLLGAKGSPGLAMPPGLVAAHAELLLLGWAAQITLGVAYWIAPRFREGPPRGREWPARAGAILLNTGIWLVATGPFLPSATLGGGASLLGAILTVLAAVGFAVHLWPRVKGVG